MKFIFFPFRLFAAGGRLVPAFALISALVVSNLAEAATNQFDFGAAGTAPGYVAVDNLTTYPGPAAYYGWLSTTGLLLRDRGGPDLLRRDFIFTTASSATFRVSGLAPGGKYLLRVTCGDASFGDHVIVVSVAGAGTLPTMSPAASEYQTLNASVDANASGMLDIAFSSPTPNWVVNALTLAPTSTNLTPFIESEQIFASTWDPAVFATDPTTNLLNRFNGTGAVNFAPTGLTRSNYLVLIASEVDFWKTKQDANGAIIDPYTVGERQYSTPAFANAAAALVVYAGRADLLEPAAKAMDWASLRLHNNAGADGHDDFYPAMLAHTLRLLSNHVDAARVATWKSNLSYDPYAIYDYAPGSFNWTVIASGGDALLQLMGIRSTNNTYVTEVWAAQGFHFLTPYGLYMEGPMCYDIFPRVFVTDAMEQGYSGPYSAEMRQAMDRAAIAGLFMQSPWGELPAGGRSAHHQWNEAEQSFIYEVYAAKAKANGNLLLAAAYKRAAHLSLASMFRWVRPSGEMQIVKNWVDPSSRFGYESYSYHSQYNLMPMMILATAYEYAAATEDVAEGPAPSDTGGFVFQIDRTDTPSRPHKIFANAGGTYVEVETFADNVYDAQGLIRVHQIGLLPQVGLTDSLLTGASYNSPNPAPLITGAGVAWLDIDGTTWHTLGEMGAEVSAVTMTPILQSSTNVTFDVTYTGSLPNVTSITEHYVVTPAGVALTTTVAGYSGALRYIWPIHSNDGKTASTIGVSGNTVSVFQAGAAATFTASGAQSVRVENPEYSNHNGWARLAFAEYPAGGNITLLISQQKPDVNIVSKTPTGNVYSTTPTLEVVIEDNQVTVNTNQVILLLDGNPVPPGSIAKVGNLTTVRYVSASLSYGTHTVGVVAGPSTQTNEWTFSVWPLPPVRTGPITYVDATSGSAGNTTQWGGSAWLTFNPPKNQTSTADNQWEEEETGFGGFGNGPTSNWFESNREGTENCPQLRTRVTGLADQTYAVYAYFWVANGQGFKFGAALSNNPSGSLPLYAVGGSGVTAALATDFTNVVKVVEADRTMYQVALGIVTGTSVAVYIDDQANGGYSSSCWFDGIGYARNVATAPVDVTVTVSNGVPQVYWAGSHKGWILQTTTNLVGGTWVDVTGSNTNTAWNIPGVGLKNAEFFRLRYPLN